MADNEWERGDLERQARQNDEKFEALCKEMGLGDEGRQQLQEKIELDSLVFMERIQQILCDLDCENPATRECAIQDIVGLAREPIFELLNAVITRIEALEQAVKLSKESEVGRGW